MKRNRFVSFAVVALAVSLSACHGLPLPGGGGGSGGGGTATVALTLRDTPPAGVDILSFTVTISGIQLNNATANVALNPLPTTPIDLTRLQTDSTFVGTFKGVAANSFTGITVGLSAASVTFLNTTATAVAGCPAATICTMASILPTSPITINKTFQLTANQVAGLSLDFNLLKAFVVSNGKVAVDFSQTGALSIVNLPLTGMPSGSLDLIEDFTGTATVSGSTVTVTSLLRGQLVATAGNNVEFDDPQGLCNGTPGLNCMTGKTVSVNASLNTDGSVSLLEVDFLDSKALDKVEGLLLAGPTPGQFSLVLSDKIISTQNSVLASTPIGTVLNFTLAGNTNFLIDSNTLSNVVTSGFSSSADLLDGQEVMLEVQSATSSNSVINIVASQVLLRFTRFTATVTVGGPAFTVSQASLPMFLQIFTGDPQVQTFVPQTTFEGVADANSLTNGSVVSVRALLLRNVAPPFDATKVRLQQ